MLLQLQNQLKKAIKGSYLTNHKNRLRKIILSQILKINKAVLYLSPHHPHEELNVASTSTTIQKSKKHRPEQHKSVCLRKGQNTTLSEITPIQKVHFYYDEKQSK
jgi:hypothetical protein